MFPTSILAAKFQVPVLRPNRVQRSRLVEKLDQAYRFGSRMTLICAPAGYGKTTLAVEWLQTQPSVAWVSLDERDNDPARFFTCLVTSLRNLDPEIGARTLNLLNIPQPPPVEHVVGEFLSEVSTLAQPFVLALDDYHHVHLATIHEAVELLLNYQPANLHLLLTTREDPAFPLSRLRAGGQLSEIRLHDLRFNGDEVRDFLAQVRRLDLSQASIEKLHRITEGWAAGLQLAGLAIQNEAEAELFFDTFGGAHPYIIEYLLDEVLHRQPEIVQRFLTDTSILERFNADLCSAVLKEEVDCRAVMADLERSNLFLGALDARHEWFRYHRLFADVLRAGIEPQREIELHRRAASWFEAHELPSEAIPHYLAAGATRDAGRLIRTLAGGWVRQGELQTLLSWTRSLPIEELHADSTLLAYQALTLLLTGDLMGALALLNSAGQGQELPGRGALLAVQAWLQMVSGDRRDLQTLAQTALVSMAPEETIFRTLALLVLGDTYFVNQQITASTEAYQEAYLLGLRTQHPFAAMAGLANLVFNLFDLGQMRRAMGLCLDAQARYTDPHGQFLPILGMIDVPLSVLYLEQGEVAKAITFAQRGRDLCQKLFSSGMMGGDAEYVLALAAHIEGRREEAYRILSGMRYFAAQHGVAALEEKMTIAEAELRMREGDAAAARTCLDRLDLHIREKSPQMALTRQGQEAELGLIEGRPAAALEIAARLEDSFARLGNVRRVIRMKGLMAAALHQLGRDEEAVQTFTAAVSLAAPEGYFSVLLRPALLVRDLLPRVRPSDPDFVDRLQAFLPPSDPSDPSGIAVEPQRAETHVAMPPEPQISLEEPLSDQERKILKLLAAGCSNQEISEALFISVGTVKWHVHHVLEKLGVSSRSQAAAKAPSLGLA